MEYALNLEFCHCEGIGIRHHKIAEALKPRRHCEERAKRKTKQSIILQKVDSRAKLYYGLPRVINHARNDKYARL